MGRRACIYLSKEAVSYKKKVAECVVESGFDYQFTGRLRVVIYAFVPDNRVRDLDNILKGLLDALTGAGIWVDDSQIDDLRVIRCEKVSKGKIIIIITEVFE